MEPKSGLKSSEFWMALVMQVSGILALWLGLQSGDSEVFTGAVEKIGFAVSTILTQGVVAWKYIAGRQELKMKSVEESK